MRRGLNIVWILLGLLALINNQVTAQSASVFKIGIIPYKSEQAIMSTYPPLLGYIAESLGKKVQIELVAEEDLAFLLKQGEYDMGIFTPFPYLKAKMDYPNLEVFASHTVNGEDEYHGCILIRKESGIKALSQLKGKKFLFVKPSSTSGYKYPKGIFKERDLDIDKGFFESYSFSGGHVASLDSLRSGKADGIAIDTRFLAGIPAADQGKYEQLSCYEVPYHAYVFSPKLNLKQREAIKQVMFDAHNNPAKRNLFSNPLKIEKWHPQSDESYNPLRRYLRIVRVKPNAGIFFDIRRSAQKALDQQGDMLELLEERSVNQLKKSQRFTEVRPGKDLTNTQLAVQIKLSMIDTSFHFNLYLNEQLIDEGYMPLSKLLSSLPDRIQASVLGNISFHSPLLLNTDKKWFITYGENDGLNVEDYVFEIEDKKGKVRSLRPKDVLSMTPLNTFLKRKSYFEEDLNVRVLYKFGANYHQDEPEIDTANQAEKFWDNIDNRWGVVGLIVALMSLLLGSYFTNRRKKRFRALLQETNGLLFRYFTERVSIEVPLLAQKDAIYQKMEKGIINENQFLILNKRLDDIADIVQKHFPLDKPMTREVKADLEEILKDGNISEKEFSRILSLVRKYGA